MKKTEIDEILFQLKLEKVCNYDSENHIRTFKDYATLVNGICDFIKEMSSSFSEERDDFNKTPQNIKDAIFNIEDFKIFKEGETPNLYDTFMSGILSTDHIATLRRIISDSFILNEFNIEDISKLLVDIEKQIKKASKSFSEEEIVSSQEKVILFYQMLLPDNFIRFKNSFLDGEFKRILETAQNFNSTERLIILTTLAKSMLTELKKGIDKDSLRSDRIKGLSLDVLETYAKNIELIMKIRK